MCPQDRLPTFWPFQLPANYSDTHPHPVCARYCPILPDSGHGSGSHGWQAESSAGSTIFWLPSCPHDAAPPAPPRDTSGGGALFPTSCRDPTHRAAWELTSRPVILPGYISPGSPRSIVRPPPAMAVRDSRIQAPGTRSHSQPRCSKGQTTVQNGRSDSSP